MCIQTLQTTIILFKHTASLHKNDYSSRLLCLAFFFWQSQQFDKFSCRRVFMISPFRKHLWLRLLLLYYQCILCKCKQSIVVFVVVFLFTCLPFLILVFVVILNSTIICKQFCLLYYFVFVAFVHNFNNKRYKSENTNIQIFSR